MGVVTVSLFWPSPIQGESARLLGLLFLSFDKLDMFAGVTDVRTSLADERTDG